MIYAFNQCTETVMSYVVREPTRQYCIRDANSCEQPKEDVL